MSITSSTSSSSYPSGDKDKYNLTRKFYLPNVSISVNPSNLSLSNFNLASMRFRLAIEGWSTAYSVAGKSGNITTPTIATSCNGKYTQEIQSDLVGSGWVTYIAFEE